MSTTFRMFTEQSFLGGRSTANRVRNAALALLKQNPAAVVSFDFDRVEGMSHSFTDELVAPLSDALGAAMNCVVVFKNCTHEVEGTVRLVCEAHRLHMPRFESSKDDSESEPARVAL